MIISSFLSDIYQKDKLLFRLGLYFLILFVLLFFPFFIDNRLVTGINPWVKPMKFSLSLSIYTWTIAWYLSYLKPLTSITKIISRTIAITMIIEMVAILLQASRGVRSHYNIDTILDSVMFSSMGIMIGVNTLAVVVLLILFFTKKPNIDPVYLNSLRIGLALFLVASYIGGVMIGHMAHAVGVEDGGAGLPFVNWSTEGGDLRAAHFFGLHAIQIFPVTTYWVSTKTNLNSQYRMIILLIFTLIFSSVLSYIYFQAMAGNPLIRI